MGRSLLMILAILLPATLSAGMPPAGRKDGITFSNIAPGEFDRKETGWLKNFDAKVALVSESGAPYAGVFLRVFNQKKEIVFKYLCEKPWLFLNLPEGTYRVIGVDRKRHQREATLQVKNGRLNAVSIVWPKGLIGY